MQITLEDDLADEIRSHAKADGRTVSNWCAARLREVLRVVEEPSKEALRAASGYYVHTKRGPA